MKPRRSTNLDMLTIVAKGLKGLKERVVFVGGATIELYVATSTPEGRATDDVDCVVEMASRVNCYALEEELRRLGFKHPTAERAPEKFGGLDFPEMSCFPTQENRRDALIDVHFQPLGRIRYAGIIFFQFERREAPLRGAKGSAEE